MTLFELVAKLSLDSSEYEKGLSGAKKKVATFGKVVKGGLVTSAKLATGAVMAVGGATVATGAIITKATGKVAEFGDHIDKASQKMGISAEKYQEWDAILQHSGSSIDAMKGGMRTLANAVEKGSDAFQRLGISQEQVKSMSQEELFEATIAGLQKVESTTERTYLASKLLGRGATELGALLNTSAEDTEKMRQRVHELGGVMSDDAVKASAQYQDSLQDLTTAFEGTKRQAVSNFLPAMVTVMDGLTSIFAKEDGGVAKVTEGVNGIIEAIGTTAPKFAGVISSVGKSLIDAIGQNLPTITQKLVEFAGQAITSLFKAIPSIITGSMGILTAIGDTVVKELPKLGSKILKALPKLLETIGKTFGDFRLDMGFMDKIGEGVAQGIPNVLSMVMPMLMKLSESLRANAGIMISAGLDLLVNIAKGLADSLPVLIETVPTIVTNIAGIINDNAPKLLITAGKIILILAQGIIKAIPTLIANLPKIIWAIWSVFTAVNWLQLGSSIITGIGKGVKSVAQDLPNTLKGIGEKAVEWLSTIQWSTLGRDIIDLIIIGVQSLSQAIPKLLVSIGKTAIVWVKNINWIGLGTAVISAITTGLKSVGSKVWNALKSIAKSAVEKVKEINWKNVGVNIIKGIVSGITGAPVSIVNALVNKLKAAYNGACKYLDSHSPSRLFRRGVGENITKGIALGIEDKAPDVLNALNDMNNRMIMPDLGNTISYQEQPATGWDVLESIEKGSAVEVGTNRKDEPVNVTTIIELDSMTVARAIYNLYNGEEQRVGVKLAGGYA